MAQGDKIHALGTDSKSIEDYYEEWGTEKYEACLKEWGYTAPERVTELIKRHGPPPSKAKVLDAGVGTGVQATAMKDAGYVKVTGIDIWQGGLDKAKERGFYKVLAKADMNEPLPKKPCADAAFDVVVSVGVLTYIDPESCCLRELLRVLKPGGIVCYTNRTDKTDSWVAAEQKLVDDCSWELIERSERVPYLPHNKEFGKDTEIVISTWRKLRKQPPIKLRKPRWSKVEKVNPESRGINLMLKCVSCKEVQLEGSSGPSGIWEAVVGDETGIVTLQLRNEEHAKLCEAGASLRMQNAKTVMIKGFIRVSIDKWAVLKKADELVSFEAKTSKDVSAVEYELAS